MKLTDIDDFEYSPPSVDLSNFFTVSELVNGDGSVVDVYNLNEGVSISGMEDFRNLDSYVYTVRDGENLKLISYNKYGSIDYWWLIAKINGISDVLKKMEGGTRIYLLEKSHMDLIYNYMIKDR